MRDMADPRGVTRIEMGVHDAIHLTAERAFARQDVHGDHEGEHGAGDNRDRRARRREHRGRDRPEAETQ